MLNRPSCGLPALLPSLFISFLFTLLLLCLLTLPLLNLETEWSWSKDQGEKSSRAVTVSAWRISSAGVRTAVSPALNPARDPALTQELRWASWGLSGEETAGEAVVTFCYISEQQQKQTNNNSNRQTGKEVKRPQSHFYEGRTLAPESQQNWRTQKVQ